MSRRVLTRPVIAEVKGLDRMAPGGRLYSETPIEPFWRPIGEGGNALPGLRPTQVDWHGFDTFSGQSPSPGMTGTRQIFAGRNVTDLTGDITTFLFFSTRRLHGITLPPQWSILDRQYSTGFGLDANPVGVDEPATWEWGIAVSHFSDGIGPPYQYSWSQDLYPNVGPSATPYYSIYFKHLMFRGAQGGRWLTQRVGGALGNARPVFVTPPAEWGIRFQVLFSRAFYANWVSPPGPPATIPQVMNPSGFTDVAMNPTRTINGTSGSWDSAANTTAQYVTPTLVSGQYQFSTIGIYGIPAWQMVNIGWAP